MDNFRVLEPIIGFSSQAHATSLSYLIYNDLTGDNNRVNSASVTSILTILGVLVLLTPLLIKQRKDLKKEAS